MSASNSSVKPKPKTFDVFVSHSSKDKTYADAIVKQFEKAGLRCWIAPRDIVPGSDYGASIIEGIESSRLMVLVFSAHANDSPQINREVERAVHHRIKIVPFRIQNIPPARNLEYFISSPHWLDAFSGKLEENIAYLTKTVNHILENTLSVPTAPIHEQLRPQYIWKALTSRFGLKGSLAICLLIPMALIIGLRIAFAPNLVDPAFYGDWQVVMPNTGMTLLPSVSSDGTYEVKTLIREDGVVQIRQGQVYLRPQSGYERMITWEPIDDTKVKSLLLPNTFWQITMLGGSPESAMRITAIATNTVWTKQTEEKKPGMATWTFEPPIEGQKWKLMFQTGPGTAYVIKAANIDHGKMRAKEGHWTMASDHLPPLSGEFEIIDQDSISMSSPFGHAVWKRAK